MSRVLLGALTLAGMIPHAAASQEQYLCQANEAAGVRYDPSTGSWEGMGLRTTSKFIITVPKEDDLHPYTDSAFVVLLLGDQFPSYQCSEGFTDLGFLACDGPYGAFAMNNRSLRFQAFYSLGYVKTPEVPDGEGNTPGIQIGVCSPF